MRSLKVRDVIIGEGIPKTCISLTGKDIDALCVEAQDIFRSKADIAEWRADFYDQINDIDSINSVFLKLRQRLKNKPIIFTFRSLAEGGNQFITSDNYRSLLIKAITSGLIDIIDIELESSRAWAKEMICQARLNNVKVILSKHNFSTTPPKEEIIEIYKEMKDLCCDIPKIALMANSYENVATVLVTSDYINKMTDRPFILLAMGDKGAVSRFTGSLFGSAITYASINGDFSAPGQIDIDQLIKLLYIFQEYKK